MEEKIKVIRKTSTPYFWLYDRIFYRVIIIDGRPLRDASCLKEIGVYTIMQALLKTENLQNLVSEDKKILEKLLDDRYEKNYL